MVMMSEYLIYSNILFVDAEGEESTILAANQNGGRIRLEGRASGRNDGVGGNRMSFKLLMITDQKQ